MRLIRSDDWNFLDGVYTFVECGEIVNFVSSKDV